MSKYLISIIGPTAIGKTSLSIKLAQHFKTEIISADSRQFFREMSIGTAAPSQEELNAVRHHFIHHKSIHDDYNVGAFEKEALSTLNTLFKSHKVVILVGGSGLYIDAITKGLDSFPEIDKTIRKKLNETLKLQGLSVLQNQLKTLDIDSYNTIAIDNPHRVIRALEICIGTGLPYASFKNKTKSARPFKTITIGLTGDRDIIYNRINQRVDIMIKNGLLEEVANLEKHKHLNALNTVGYKELFNYMDGMWPLDFAISEIKKNTRRFAKRQLTWFKKNENTVWFDFKSDLQLIIHTIEQVIQAH
jgi:tRNA dimethylallyltransferase